MALYSIEFHRVEHYYLTEHIDAESEEQAKDIAEKLLDSDGYVDTLIDDAVIEWSENEVQSVDPADPADDSMFPSLTQDMIDEYLED